MVFVFLAAEIVEQVARRHAGPGGDVREGRTRVALVDDAVVQCLENAPAALRTAGLAATPGGLLRAGGAVQEVGFLAGARQSYQNFVFESSSKNA